MRFKVVEQFSVLTEDVECLTVHLGKVTASVIYRPSTGDKETFCKFLDAVLSSAYSSSEPVIIMGDVNIDMSSQDTWELNSILACHACTNHVKLPTRVTENSGISINICVTNSNDEIFTSVLSYK